MVDTHALNEITAPHQTTTIHRIDEDKLNRLFDSVPTDALKNIIRRKLPNLSKRRLRIKPTKSQQVPKLLQNAIAHLKLLDEENFDRRAQIFIGYCKYHNYSYNTAVRYFRILKTNGIFGQGSEQSLLKPDRIAFVDNGKLHVRIVSMKNFINLTKYLHEHWSKYTAPILIAIYTGLRTSEILQFSAYTLYQLQTRQQTVAIKRKQTVMKANDEVNEPINWKPIYNTWLTLLVDRLILLYRNEYDVLQKDQVNSKLFYVTPKTLGNRIKTLYYTANGYAAPNGFGIHSCRNMISMLMAETTDNLTAIQSFLQHKNTSTTRQYIKADFTYATKEFNRITNYELANVRNNLKQPPLSQKPERKL